MKFEDYGDDKYKFPEVYLYPEKTNKQYFNSDRKGLDQWISWTSL